MKYLKHIESIIILHKKKILFLQIIMFIVFVFFFFVPPYTRIPTSIDTVFSNLRLFSKMLIWVLWFPLVFFSTLIWGRSWCGLLCPLGALSEWSGKIGLKKNIPFWMKWAGIPILSFTLVTIFGQTLDIRSYVESMAFLFSIIISIAIIIGYIYGNNKRAWCRYMCPIGWLLGVYSRLGIFELKTKRSVTIYDVETEKTMCPMLINIKTKKQSLHCINCMRCVVPNANGGLRPYMRVPGHEIAYINEYTPQASENIFFFLVAGLSMGGTLWLFGSQFIHYKIIIASFFYQHNILWPFHVGSRFLMAVYPGREQFTWLDFICIVSYMIAYAILIGILLCISNFLFTWIGFGKKKLKDNFIISSYQYAPNVMISILLTTGASLFQLLHAGFFIKTFLFWWSALWGIILGYKILNNQNIKSLRCVLACTSNIILYSILYVLWLPAFS